MPTREDDTVELVIPCDPKYVTVVRLTVAGVAARSGLTVDDIDDLKVAVSEACTNAIDHAFDEAGGQPGPHVHVRLYPKDGEMRIEVEDEGQGFDPRHVKKALEAQEPGQEGGLGLYLIERLTDELRVESAPGSGTKITMTKRVARKS
jgi:serine/threonine-protein kinase RsbW